MSLYPGGIFIEPFPLESTGGKVWDASFKFLEFLLRLEQFNGCSGQRVLELGSGCGWLGMRVGRKFPSWTVVTSERGSMGALRCLNHNLGLNTIANVSSIELDWSDLSSDVKSRGWDFIIGCELVYSYDGARLLPKVIADLLRGTSTVCYYAHSLNRFESVDEVLLSEFRRNQLNVKVVHGRGNVFDDESIGSFNSLFNDLELVIFKITVS